MIAAMKKYPKRFVGLGSIRLDDPEAVRRSTSSTMPDFAGWANLPVP